jgi:predicted nicotinamide N-methyase
VSVQRIDWRCSRLDHKFDRIAGSDIVYDRSELQPLDRFWREHLKPRGQVLLSDPSRPMTREFLETFRRFGWQMEETAVEVTDLRQPIRIVTMQIDA